MKLRRTDAIVYEADRKSSNSKASPHINTENSQTDVKIRPWHFRHSFRAGHSCSCVFQPENPTQYVCQFSYPNLPPHSSTRLSCYRFDTCSRHHSPFNHTQGFYDNLSMLSCILSRISLGGNYAI